MHEPVNLMVPLYYVRVFSSRRIERRLVEDIAFRVVAGLAAGGCRCVFKKQLRPDAKRYQ
jgi:hypothetical protein